MAKKDEGVRASIWEENDFDFVSTVTQEEKESFLNRLFSCFSIIVISSAEIKTFSIVLGIFGGVEERSRLPVIWTFAWFIYQFGRNLWI